MRCGRAAGTAVLALAALLGCAAQLVQAETGTLVVVVLRAQIDEAFDEDSAWGSAEADTLVKVLVNDVEVGTTRKLDATDNPEYYFSFVIPDVDSFAQIKLKVLEASGIFSSYGDVGQTYGDWASMYEANRMSDEITKTIYGSYGGAKTISSLVYRFGFFTNNFSTMQCKNDGKAFTDTIYQATGFVHDRQGFYYSDSDSESGTSEYENCRLTVSVHNAESFTIYPYFIQLADSADKLKFLGEHDMEVRSHSSSVPRWSLSPLPIMGNKFTTLFNTDTSGYDVGFAFFYEANFPPPPVSCDCSDWSSWSHCSASVCGAGERQRTRSCSPAKNGGTCSFDISNLKATETCSAPTPCCGENNDKVCKCFGLNCGLHGHCVEPVRECNCTDGFKGDLCDDRPICFGIECGDHGDCVDDVCVCKNDYTGALCDREPACLNVKCDRGTCNYSKDRPEPGTICVCRDGFTGEKCDTAPKCFEKNCGEKGSCNEETGKCDCVEDFAGDSCEEPPPCYGITCNDRGSCSDDKCDCAGGWSGPDCRVPPVCYQNTCSGHGKCAENVCRCNEGWVGAECEQERKESSTGGSGSATNGGKAGADDSDDDSGGSVPIAAIAGGAGAAALLLIIIIILLVVRRRGGEGKSFAQMRMSQESMRTTRHGDSAMQTSAMSLEMVGNPMHGGDGGGGEQYASIVTAGGGGGGGGGDIYANTDGRRASAEAYSKLGGPTAGTYDALSSGAAINYADVRIKESANRAGAGAENYEGLSAPAGGGQETYEGLSAGDTYAGLAAAPAGAEMYEGLSAAPPGSENYEGLSAPPQQQGNYEQLRK